MRVTVACGPSFEPIDEVRRMTSFSVGLFLVAVARVLLPSSFCLRSLKRSGFLLAVAATNPCIFGMDREVIIESPDTKVALIELFTSEGCSSCPRAEAWVGALRDESGPWKEFVPVAFHVDYWNHLGWRDRFSSAAFTRRQRDYSAQWNSTTIYTPGFVLNGEEWRPGSGLPSPSREKPGKLHLTVEKNGAQLEVSFFSSVNREEPLVVEVVPLAQGASTNVQPGENAGKKLQHDFVALALITASVDRSSDRVYRAQLSLPATTAAPIASIAAWVRPANSPVPIQAAGGWIK
jgi:hypothetical protein